MNPSTLIFLVLAVVWAVVLLPEVFRKLSGTRSSDSIRSFNQQLSVLHRSGTRRGADLPGMPRPAGAQRARSNVIDLRGRAGSQMDGRAGSQMDRRSGSPVGAASSARPVPMSVRKRRQEVLTVLACAAVLSLVCTVAFGGVFLVPLLLAAGLLVAYVALLAQANQTAPRSMGVRDSLVPHSSLPDGLRTATVGRATPAPRRIAN
jgi:hypothetical protein